MRQANFSQPPSATSAGRIVSLRQLPSELLRACGLRWQSVPSDRAIIATAMRRSRFLSQCACLARTRESRCSGDWPFSIQTRLLGAVFSKLSGITDDLKPKLEGSADHPPVHLAAGSRTIGSFVNSASAH